MALLNKRVSLLAKIETAYGTDITPAAADGFYGIAGTVPEPVMQENTLDDVTRGGTMSILPPAEPGPRHLQVNFRIPIRGAGAAYSATVLPKADAIIRAAGYQRTLTTTAGSEKVEYKPRSTGFESVSLYYNVDGLLYKLLGSRGNINWVSKNGSILYAECTMQALWTNPSDVAIVAPTGEPTVLHPVLLSSALQIGTENYAAAIENINVNLNQTLFARPDSTKADGIGAIEIVGRIPEGSMDPEAALVAAFDYYGKWKAATKMDLSYQHGSAQYNRIKFSCPQITFKNVTGGDRGGITMFNTPFKIVSDTAAGDDEITITMD